MTPLILAESFYYGGIVVKYVFLTREFYNDFITCSEIEQKDNRPYIMIIATINNLDFAIPLRSNINHNHVVQTDKQNKCGLDLSKSIVITDKNRYIDNTTKPIIRQNEFDALRGKAHFTQQRL
ncbi:MAG: hypothetical protein WA131_05170 [Desulfitobacteriaceae bacterium]